jgi:tripartite ATP-independent transporter DctP family solute receptor
MKNFQLNQMPDSKYRFSLTHLSGKTIILILSIAVILSLATAATAGPIVVKFAHSEAEIDLIQSPYLVYTSVFKRIVENETGGKYKIEVYPNKQLGDLRSMAEQVSRGIIEISGGQNAGLLSSFAPNIQIAEMPYAFPNTEIGRLVFHGWFGNELADEVAAKSNIRVISFLPSAFRSFTNNKKVIRTPADMEGMKIRTMEIPIHMEMVKALGASPTPIAWSELYSALQTGVVDGQENAPYVILLGKIQEVQKYYTLDRHTLNMALIIINEKFYQGLPAEDRRVFDYAARQAQYAFLGVVAAKEARDLETIAKAGVQIYVPTPAEYAQFQKATKEPMKKIMAQKVEEKWINKLYKALDEAEKKTGLK